MKFSVVASICMMLLINIYAVVSHAESTPHLLRQRTAKVGEPAPAFKVEAVIGREVKEITLEDYRGKQTSGLCPLNWKPGQKTLSK